MTAFILCLYILMANGVIVPVGVMAVSWALLAFKGVCCMFDTAFRLSQSKLGKVEKEAHHGD